MKASLITELLSLCFHLEWERKREQALPRRRERRLSPGFAICGGLGWCERPLQERGLSPVLFPGRPGRSAVPADRTWGQAGPTRAVCSPPQCIFSPFFPSQCEFKQILDLEIRLRMAMMCLFRNGDITGKCHSQHGFQPRPQFFPDAYIAWRRPLEALQILVQGL